MAREFTVISDAILCKRGRGGVWSLARLQAHWLTPYPTIIAAITFALLVVLLAGVGEAAEVKITASDAAQPP